jgi:hypothetical protein
MYRLGHSDTCREIATHNYLVPIRHAPAAQAVKLVSQSYRQHTHTIAAGQGPWYTRSMTDENDTSKNDVHDLLSEATKKVAKEILSEEHVLEPDVARLLDSMQEDLYADLDPALKKSIKTAKAMQKEPTTVALIRDAYEAEIQEILEAARLANGDPDLIPTSVDAVTDDHWIRAFRRHDRNRYDFMEHVCSTLDAEFDANAHLLTFAVRLREDRLKRAAEQGDEDDAIGPEWEIRIPPATFDEAVQRLHTCISDVEAIRSSSKSVDQLVTSAHHGLGRQIRNDWGLWSGGPRKPLKEDMERLGFTHPDDMSGAILRRFVSEVRGEPYNVEDNVRDCAAYWAKANG